MYHGVNCLDPLFCVWGFALLGFGALSLVLKQRRLDFKRLAFCESGASYSLSYVMSMPLLAMFLLLIFQCTLLLMAKFGVVYATYAAARSAAVWKSAKSRGAAPGAKMEEKARQAAVLAIVPFASGSKEHLTAGSGGAEWIAPYQAAAREFGEGKSISEDYLAVKVRNAAEWTQDPDIQFTADDDGGVLEVTLRYEAPYLIGWLGRIMGSGSRNGVYFHRIESSVTFPCENPRDRRDEIGIDYLSE